MSTPQRSRAFTLGIVGFGEAGQAFARHFLAREDINVAAFDKLFLEQPWPEFVERKIQQTQVQVCESIDELVACSHLVLSLVTPSAAESVVQEAAQDWPGERVLFVDLNTNPPVTKAQHVRMFRDPSCFVDGSVMDSFQNRGALVPILVSGSRAREASEAMLGLGLNVRYVGPQVGAASAIKMCRSIFTKGAECLFVESLIAAERYGATTEVLSSIKDSVTSGSFEDWVKMLVTTHAVHAGRRSDEMDKIVDVLLVSGLEPIMSLATRDRLRKTAQSGIRERFGGEAPRSISDVIDALDSAQ